MNFSIALKPNRIRLLRKVLGEIQKSNTKKHLMFLINETQFGIFTSQKDRTLMRDNIDIKCVFNLSQISHEEENEIYLGNSSCIKFSMYRDIFNNLIEQTTSMENFNKIYLSLEADSFNTYFNIKMSNDSFSNKTIMSFPIQLDHWDMELMSNIKAI